MPRVKITLPEIREERQKADPARAAKHWRECEVRWVLGNREKAGDEIHVSGRTIRELQL